MASRTALVLFTLAPRADAGRKWLGSVRHVGRAERFVAELIEHTLGVMIRSGAGDPIICCPGGRGLPGSTLRLVPQRGLTFGERFAAALEDVFARGYERVLIAGNDCPDLTPGAVRSALRRLEPATRSAVIGPARDGGFYFLALTRQSFEAVGFARLARLPWCGAETLGAIEQLFVAGGTRVARHDVATDLDSLADVERWLRVGPSPLSEAPGRLRALALTLLRAPAIPFPATRSSLRPLAPGARPASPRPPPPPA